MAEKFLFMSPQSRVSQDNKVGKLSPLMPNTVALPCIGPVVVSQPPEHSSTGVSNAFVCHTHPSVFSQLKVFTSLKFWWRQGIYHDGLLCVVDAVPHELTVDSFTCISQYHQQCSVLQSTEGALPRRTHFKAMDGLGEI